MKQIEQIWLGLLSKGSRVWPIYQRIDESHPIDFYAGVSAEGARLLMLVSATEPSQLPSFHSFDVSTARRDDGKWTVVVELRRPEFANIFGHLCDDLFDASRTECPPDRAAAYLVSRLLRWQRLLGRDRSGLLDMQSIRGLIGELLFLQKVACVAHGLDSAVRSWEGPLDAPQDFRFTGRLAEVKTCGPSGPLVWISSAEQLDPGAIPIVLAVAVIEPADQLTTGSFTLVGLVMEIREMLAAAPTALASFDEKLRLAGYTDRSEYSKDCFGLREFRFFDVPADFPSLRRQLLPDAIVSLKYQLNLSTCRAFERESAGL